MARDKLVARRTERRTLLVSLQNPRSAAEHGDAGPGATATASDSEPIAVLPLDVLLWEILIRLPAAAILRCRAVCRSWRRLTADPGFLLAHHRRQQSLPLFVLGRSYNCHTNPAGPQRGQPLLGFDDYHHYDGHKHRYLGDFVLHASCDGLLLISNRRYNGRAYRRFFIMCNLATRQSAPVQALKAAEPDRINIEALYLHRPSGQYRVLYWRDRKYQTKDGDRVFYILGVPRARKPRCIVLPAAYRMVSTMKGYPDSRPPVMFRGCLHWYPSRCSLDGAVVVFDTVAESFRSMRLPADVATASSCCTRLHDMEGLIGLSCFSGSGTIAKVWVLEDYEREVWSLKYKINFSPESMCNLAKTSSRLVVSHEGDMLLYSNNSISHMVICQRRFLEEFQWPFWGSNLTGHLFKESLVKHAFFPKPGSAHTVGHYLFTCL
ncbi:uncharacterized protein LOC112268956 [Brachypodium distachyon]|uniref:F-box domain-containing protein n=1 Tax=Brachypodium distachyon TaxID=15368 RepID=A0A0Q3EHU3_BRADI|nr:uncharacterized protein LOC112268956 [Brachypodium distachyon]KQJ87310.1 hypothetical protein BRADI_4g10300v3 [Brachypodium distachyon]|eukprot:XP_024311114.1 uncharacterized protein LOC112268956 [Brachypodium distachyon]